MPLELQLFRANEFIRLGAHGKLDRAASRATLAALAKACQVRQINQALLDVRDANTDLTANDLAALVRAFAEIGFKTRQRLALLHHGDPHYRARTFALIGRMRGWHVQAFDSFESAVMWLAQAPEPKPEIKPAGAAPVAITLKPEPKKSSTRRATS